jgi:hypothetical protein
MTARNTRARQKRSTARTQAGGVGGDGDGIESEVDVARDS